MSTDETTGIAAIKAVSDLSTHVILGLNSDISKVLQRMDRLEELIKQGNEQQVMMTKEFMRLSQEVHQMRNLLHDPTVDALTGPLLDLQKDSKRKRQISSANRTMRRDEPTHSEHFDWTPLNKTAP